jgi:hypothetical protein
MHALYHPSELSSPGTPMPRMHGAPGFLLRRARCGDA